MIKMSRKLLPLMFLVLLIGALNLALRIEKAKASGAISINADGSVGGTTQIQTGDNVTYFFTADIDGYVEIDRDNTVLDGYGYTLQGSYDYGTAAGIWLNGRTNVTIQNLHIAGHYYSIALRSSSNNTISGCKGLPDGIMLDMGSSNNVKK